MIFFRMSARLSINKPPKFKDDKYRTVRTCLKTFAKAFKGVDQKVHFLLDRCGVDYLDLIKELCPLEFTHEFSDYGHFNSILKLYNLAQETKDDTIFFIEDDYLWREGSGERFVKAVKELGIVSPYDNPDFYNVEPYKSRREQITVLDGWHWRTTQSTTMTFGITKELFMKHRKKFDYHGPSDSPLWVDVNEPIWIPIPSLATHFVEVKLAPSVDWGQYYND